MAGPTISDLRAQIEQAIALADDLDEAVVAVLLSTALDHLFTDAEQS